MRDYAIQTIQQFAFVKGKNASDMVMTIYAMDLMHREEVDIVCLVGSDYDFAPLAVRLRAAGIKVIGCGSINTSDAYMNACSAFYCWEGDLSADWRIVNVRSGKELNANTQLFATLLKCYDEDEDGWADWDTFVSNLAYSPHCPQMYGYENWWNLLESTGVFERIEREGKLKIRLVALKAS